LIGVFPVREKTTHASYVDHSWCAYVSHMIAVVHIVISV